MLILPDARSSGTSRRNNPARAWPSGLRLGGAGELPEASGRARPVLANAAAPAVGGTGGVASRVALHNVDLQQGGGSVYHAAAEMAHAGQARFVLECVHVHRDR